MSNWTRSSKVLAASIFAWTLFIPLILAAPGGKPTGVDCTVHPFGTWRYDKCVILLNADAIGSEVGDD